MTRMIGVNKVAPISDIDTINNASLDSNNSNAGDTDGGSMQTIRFAPFQQHQWHVLCNQNLQEL